MDSLLGSTEQSVTQGGVPSSPEYESFRSDTPSPVVASTGSTINSWPQIASEHCYPKLMAQWTSLDQPLPTYHVFQSESSSDTGADDSGVESTEESSISETRCGNVAAGKGQLEVNDCEEDEDIVIDVEHVTPPTSLPYNDQKVLNVMHECTQHMNLVRLPLENPDGLLEKTILESSYQQQVLIKKALDVLRAEHLARLSFVGLPEQPIQRRLSCNTASRKMRKILGDVKWDPKLTHWLHRTFLRALDNTYLPIYLDLLQVLKSKCPTLVETMIHGTNPSEGSNEAVSLLLKRPWSITVGMSPMDKRVCFDSSPVFVTIPYSNCLLGGRRWKMWQSQLSCIGKVFPVVPPDYLVQVGQDVSQVDAAEELFQCALTRLQEIKEQYVARPIVLISWNSGCRIACKLAEVERVACLVNLGISVHGQDHSWTISSDPFTSCVTPSIFITGDKGPVSSWKYVQDLRTKIKSLTSLVIIHGADDMLRLPFNLKRERHITQSMLDRLIQDRIYEFLVYVLPCSFPSDVRQFRKRKAGPEDLNSSQLSSATPNSAIILTAHAPSSDIDSSLSPILKGLLANGKMSMGSLGRSSSTSLQNAITRTGPYISNSELPSSKLPKIGRPPKNPRPRSKSTTASSLEQQKVKALKNPVIRNRSLSGDHSFPTSPDNSNCNNSNEASPNTLLAITHFQSQIPALLPVTPPKNPYENPNQISDPKIRKQLNL